MELVTSVVGGKAPRDGTALDIALRLESGDTLAQDLHSLQATRQTATCKNTDLDFGHIEPTAMDAAYNGIPRAAKGAPPRQAARMPREPRVSRRSRRWDSVDRTLPRTNAAHPPSPPQTLPLRLVCTSARVARI
jgi:hypothetical protein